MRNFTIVVATLASAFALLHCAGGSSDGSSPTPDTKPSTTAPSPEAGAPKPKSTPPVADAGGGKTVADSGTDAAPPIKGAKDAGIGNPAPQGPGPSCTTLSSCCGKLSNSLEQVGCLIASGKKNELACDAALLTFSCAAANNPGHGPSCLGLVPFLKYCGNDGPKGDANTLYECNTSSNISIVRQCPNGCTTNFGVDDSCAPAAGGGGTGGTGGTGGDSASCTGYTGAFCGSDGVGGSPNTLYNCASDKIASSQVCANGCVTNPDATLNDYCADAPPAGGGGSTGVSCTGLPDFKYCGSDGVNGDANTLYTCAGGTMTGSTPCANGCTIGSSNTDDYCAFTAGGGGTSTADCTGLTDGTYCGSNGPMGDPSTVYTCSGGSVSSSQFCSAGCFAGDFGGSDSCN
jgi:hypothetical protein